MNCTPCFTRSQCEAVRATWQKDGFCEVTNGGGLCVPPQANACPTTPLMTRRQCEGDMTGYAGNLQWQQFGQDRSKGLCFVPQQTPVEPGPVDPAPHGGQQIVAADADSISFLCSERYGCPPGYTSSPDTLNPGSGEVMCTCSGEDCRKHTVCPGPVPRRHHRHHRRPAPHHRHHWRPRPYPPQPEPGPSPPPYDPSPGGGDRMCAPNPCPPGYDVKPGNPWEWPCGADQVVCERWVSARASEPVMTECPTGPGLSRFTTEKNCDCANGVPSVWIPAGQCGCHPPPSSSLTTGGPQGCCYCPN